MFLGGAGRLHVAGRVEIGGERLNRAVDIALSELGLGLPRAQRDISDAKISKPHVAELLAVDLRGGGVPSREKIREQISGNYCRCTGYHAIVDAIESVAAARAGGKR